METSTATVGIEGRLTCGVSELILLALYPVLEVLRIPPRGRYLRLNRLICHAVVGGNLWHERAARGVQDSKGSGRSRQFGADGVNARRKTGGVCSRSGMGYAATIVRRTKDKVKLDAVGRASPRRCVSELAPAGGR